MILSLSYCILGLANARPVPGTGLAAARYGNDGRLGGAREERENMSAVNDRAVQEVEPPKDTVQPLLPRGGAGPGAAVAPGGAAALGMYDRSRLADVAALTAPGCWDHASAIATRRFTVIPLASAQVSRADSRLIACMRLVRFRAARPQ